MQFEQGALDSLHAAKQALDRAIQVYEEGRGQTLSLDSGPLFGMLDNLDTAHQEMTDARTIARGPIEL